MNSGEKKPEPAHLRVGKWGEEVAAAHLEAKGWTLIAARVQGRYRSEIDIIARDGETLVFVEVKTRSSERMGRPIAAVDRAKRDRIGRAALAYMRRLRKKPHYFRFDVVEVVGNQQNGIEPIIRHIPNAFNLPRGYRVPW
jgi:putative endonuclease